MLRASIAFFVLALVAAIFGFTGIASSAAGIGKILFAVFMVLAVLGLLIGGFSSKKAV